MYVAFLSFADVAKHMLIMFDYYVLVGMGINKLNFLLLAWYSEVTL